MSCRTLQLMLLVHVASCTVDDVPIIEIPARAGMEVTIGPAVQEPLADGTGEYRWELALAPEASDADEPMGAATAEFLPDVRGIYVVERWLTYGLSEALTHRFVVRTEGAPPLAVIRANPSATIGTAISIDGSESSSPEGLPLVHRWRLTERPRDSAAVIENAQATTASLVPDQAGDFVVDLSVFDGALWSSRVTVTIHAL
jgi:hypothetical protein